MKGIIKNILLFAFALYIAGILWAGLVVHGGIENYIVGGLLLAIGFKIIKPILSLITLPFSILTLGLFNIVIIAFILFLITLIFPLIEVHAFTYSGFNAGSVLVHAFYVSSILSYCLVSATIHLTTKLINWLFD